LEKASGLGIWLYAVACLLLTLLAIVVWVRFVPAKASFIVAGILWILTLWILSQVDLANSPDEKCHLTSR